MKNYIKPDHYTNVMRGTYSYTPTNKSKRHLKLVKRVTIDEKRKEDVVRTLLDSDDLEGLFR